MRKKAIALLLVLLLCACSLPLSSPLLRDDVTGIQGRILYISSANALSVVSREGSQIIAETSRPISTCALSPDGTQFAFISSGRLWTGRVATHAVTDTLWLGVLDWDAYSLEWSPLGERVAFVYPREEGYVVTMYDLATEDLVVLTPPATSPFSDTVASGVDWITGQKLIFGTGSALWIYDLTVSKAERLTPALEGLFQNSRSSLTGELHAATPVVSHNGKMGAVEWYDQQPEIRVYDLETGALLHTILRPARRNISALTWSPDDSRLAFVETAAKNWFAPGQPDTGDIVIVDVDGNNAVKVGRGLAVELDGEE